MAKILRLKSDVKNGKDYYRYSIKLPAKALKKFEHLREDLEIKITKSKIVVSPSPPEPQSISD
ncbi:MAG: hypothetical protein JEZ07_12505 [Phycisphaerae bacterium]|nr:hypothetical protein [Phycisphaerae bacterium]